MFTISVSFDNGLFQPQIHEQMLSKAPPVPQTLPNVPNEESNELPASDPSGEHADKVDEGDNTSGSVSDSSSGLPVPESESGVTENTGETSAVEVANHHVPEASHRENIPRVSSSHQNPAVAIQKPKHDRLLTLAAFGLTLAIMALVIKKFLKINGLGGFIEGKF
jgi:ubiquitin-conjugating enzyme E2 J1